jgi:hypothetical protein
MSTTIRAGSASIGGLAVAMLTPLRAFADRTGEIGALAMLGLPFFTAFSLLSTEPGHQVRNIVCFCVIGLEALAVFARHGDWAGHKAMNRLTRKSAKKDRTDPAYLEGLEWLKLDRTATVEDIKSCVRAVIKANHGKTGPEALDMDALVKMRNNMVLYAQGLNPAEAGPSPEALLRTYRKNAGKLGMAWGRMFPSTRLKELGFR